MIQVHWKKWFKKDHFITRIDQSNDKRAQRAVCPTGHQNFFQWIYLAPEFRPIKFRNSLNELRLSKGSAILIVVIVNSLHHEIFEKLWSWVSWRTFAHRHALVLSPDFVHFSPNGDIIVQSIRRSWQVRTQLLILHLK